MIYYRCGVSKCSWIAQAEKKPLQCVRCLAVGTKLLTTEEIVEAHEQGEISYCSTCGVDHSTSLGAHYTR